MNTAEKLINRVTKGRTASEVLDSVTEAQYMSRGFYITTDYGTAIAKMQKLKKAGFDFEYNDKSPVRGVGVIAFASRMDRDKARKLLDESVIGEAVDPLFKSVSLPRGYTISTTGPDTIHGTKVEFVVGVESEQDQDGTPVNVNDVFGLINNKYRYTWHMWQEQWDELIADDKIGATFSTPEDAKKWLAKNLKRYVSAI